MPNRETPTRSEPTGDAPVRVEVVTGGHPFDAEAFFAVFDAFAASGRIEWHAATTPSAPGHDDVTHDVTVFYDMPGLRFVRSADDPHYPVELVEPTTAQQDVYSQLTSAGVGLVFLHHAVASWPAWPGFAELVGARFHYQPGELRGMRYPDSGYRFDVTHTVEVLDERHPVCVGLDPSFTITDELYCFPVLERDVAPLMRTTYDTADCTSFFSADAAIRGRRDDNSGWTHPAGSDLVAWTRAVRASRLVYLQFGDGPVTYADPSFRAVLANAIEWTARRT
jgi:hypothetical protein